MRLYLPALSLLLLPLSGFAAPGLEAFTLTPSADGNGQTYTLSLQVLFFMTALSLLPGALLMMTSFARVVIVLAILRQALGTQHTPSNQILIGLALFLTVFIMMPVFEETYQVGVEPYLEGEIAAQQAVEKASFPVREFMLAQEEGSGNSHSVSGLFVRQVI